jgi:hypothetical protein
LLTEPWEGRDDSDALSMDSLHSEGEQTEGTTGPASPSNNPQDFQASSELLARFSLSLPMDNTRQSLKTLTAKLLLARQRGRRTEGHRLWAIDQDNQLQNTGFSTATFAGVPVNGLRLHIVSVNILNGYKLCSFGCKKEETYRAFSNVTLYP